MENSSGLHLRFYEVEPGEVRAEYTPPNHFQGFPGVLHGGIIASMLDEACGRAHLGSGPPRFMYTAKLEIKYRKNVPIGAPLSLVGKARSSRGRVAESWAGVYNADGELLAEARGMLIDLPEGTLPSADLSELGWKVYAEPSE